MNNNGVQDYNLLKLRTQFFNKENKSKFLIKCSPRDLIHPKYRPDMIDNLNHHEYFGDFQLYKLLKLRLFWHHWIILFCVLFTTTPNLERTFCLAKNPTLVIIIKNMKVNNFSILFWYSMCHCMCVRTVLNLRF